MNTATDQSFSLRARVAECERYALANSKSYAESEPKAGGRAIRLRNCLIIETDFERGGELPITDTNTELWIDELYAGLVDIGSFTSFHDIRLRLPPSTFSHFWTASAARDGAAREIVIYFKADETEAFKITRVLLVEHITESNPIYTESNSVHSDHLPAHVPPVVTEMHADMPRYRIMIGLLFGFASGAILAVIGHELWRGFHHE
jgi:hypothetical protein